MFIAVRRLFEITCFALAGYMIYLQFQSYISNEDASSVLYQHFNARPDDIYPAYSICMIPVTDPKNILKNNVLKSGKDSFGNTVEGSYLYAEMLWGRKNMPQSSLIEYEDVVLSMEQFIKQKTSSVNGNQWTTESKDNDPLLKSHQEAGVICLTNKRVYKKLYVLGKGELREKDEILEFPVLYREVLRVNTSALNQLGFTLKLFVHQKGRLLTHFDDSKLDFAFCE